jgi:hypothetical protein
MHVPHNVIVFVSFRLQVPSNFFLLFLVANLCYSRYRTENNRMTESERNVELVMGKEDDHHASTRPETAALLRGVRGEQPQSFSSSV